MPQRRGEIRVVKLDDGWMVQYASGRTDQFSNREIALIVAEHAARNRGYAVTVEEAPHPGIVLDDMIPEVVTEAVTEAVTEDAPLDNDDDRFAHPS